MKFSNYFKETKMSLARDKATEHSFVVSLSVIPLSIIFGLSVTQSRSATMAQRDCVSLSFRPHTFLFAGCMNWWIS